VFAAGGSGGHLFPAIAVAEEILSQRPDASITLLTSTKTIDATIAAAQQTAWETISIPARSPGEWRTAPWPMLRDNWRAWRAAGEVLETRKPSVVVGCGGFASFPTLLAARARRIPIVLLEQNAIPGRVTRWWARRAARVCCAFEQCLDHLPRTKAAATGNPVRKSIQRLHRRAASEVSARRTLLVLGGSQGAQGINAAMLEISSARPELFRGWRVVHQTGDRDRAAAEETYRASGLDAEIIAFSPDIPRTYAEAGLVVSRGGATTLAELACAGLPSILVPYPQAADDHQRANASIFVEAGASVVVDQIQDVFAERLEQALLVLLSDAARRGAMSEAAAKLGRPDASRTVADLILELATTQPGSG